MQLRGFNFNENVVFSRFFSNCSASVGHARAHTPQAVQASETIGSAKPRDSRGILSAVGAGRCEIDVNSRIRSRPGFFSLVV